MTKYLALILTLSTVMVSGIVHAEMHCQPVFEGSAIVDCNEGVILTIKQFTQITCPGSRRNVISNLDGTYTRYGEAIKPTDLCFEIKKHKELWSDYPVRSGTFIRVWRDK